MGNILFTFQVQIASATRVLKLDNANIVLNPVVHGKLAVAKVSSLNKEN